MSNIHITLTELRAAQAALGHKGVPVYKAYKRAGKIVLVTRFGKQTYTPPPKPKRKPKPKSKSGD